MGLRRGKIKSKSSLGERVRARLRLKPRTSFQSVIEKIKTIVRDRTDMKRRMWGKIVKWWAKFSGGSFVFDRGL